MKMPTGFKSTEGWSSETRKGKTVTGYYASWHWYDNSERATPTNLQFTKVDRVNFAFFHSDESGNIWGTDPWADAQILFGPADWMVTTPADSGYAPQFNDDNGFEDGEGGSEGYNYVGGKYVDLGPNVYCHRGTPTGKRECKGYVHSQGLIGRAHSQGAHVYVSIGGWGLSSVFPKMAENAKGRRNFAKNCVGLVREYGFDGIDISWEFPG